MPTLSDILNLDPNVERLTLLPRLRGSLPSEKSVMMPDRYMFDVIAPKFLYDFIRAVKAPGRAAKGEALDEEEALNTAMNMFGGGLATSGSVPLGALGMSARTAPTGSIPLREVPRSPLGFYSKVEEATLPLQNKGSGSQFLAQIQKTPGVKPEEIEVLGLDKFLQSKPTVTKQEIQDYITANKPDVQEVRLGGATSPYPYRTADEWQNAINRAEARGNWDEASNLNQAWEAAEGFGGVGAPKFSQYTIPGGENYRELLLTLPQKSVTPIEGGKSVATEVFERTMTDKYGGNTFSSVYNRLDPNEIDKYEMLIREDRNSAKTESILRDKATNYRSSHYPDQPNILTHLRANDRVIDGKKALFIEEIQSDWHQAGRKKGYAQPETKRLTGVVEQEPPSEFGFAPEWKVVWEDGTFSGGYGSPEAAAARLAEGKSNAKQGVPDAPFKKSWHELALKRAIQEAVDKGYDKLAFTTGKTQAERYDLSKQVKRLVVAKSGDQFNIGGVDINDQPFNIGKKFANELSDVVGKDLAEKISKQQTANEVYAGKDLVIGGEGMKGFYDEILPKALQNLTKKYGTKVTKSKLDEGSEVWSMDITPQMREQVKAKGQPLFATAPPLGLATQDPLEQFLQTDEARNDPFMQFLGYNR